MAPTVPLIFNPAHRPGVEPLRTPLRGDATRGILWDQALKPVPEPTATDLLQYGGCHRCLSLGEVATTYGLPEKRVQDLLRSPKVTTATYQPPRSAGSDEEPEPVTVVVLDVDTRRRLRKESPAQQES